MRDYNLSMQFLFKICLLFVAVLLFYAAYLSFRWAVADILSIQIRHQLHKAQFVNQPLDAKQWRLTRSLLEKVLWLYPENSDYLELAAFFYQVSADQSPELLNELGWHDSQENALRIVRRTLLLRPSWPYLWDDLIVNKIALQQFDRELTRAFERAVTLGPWEDAVQYDVAFMGLGSWHDLDISVQRLVVGALDRILVMQRDPRKLVKEIRGHPNYAQVCRSLNETSDMDLNTLVEVCK
jgi:hypothetical protein